MAKVFPSLLAADFSNLESELNKVSTADALHLDIMDGAFVDNISFGIPVIKSIRKITSMQFDTHLMIQNPKKFIEQFIEAGSNSLSFHIEAAKDAIPLLKKIKSLGAKAGIAIDLNTKAETVFPVLKFCDFVLIMTVKAGFGGQSFQESALQKIKAISKEIKRQNLSTEISVDGGINNETAKLCLNAGANILIAGSHIFKSEKPEQAIRELKCIAQR
jgi:ribulose-phosphate 3-epimerase